MKSLISPFVFALVCMHSYAQVGINTTNPDPNSQLDVNGKVLIRDYSRSSSGINGVKAVFAEADGTLIGVNIPTTMLEEDINNDLTLVAPLSSYGAVEKIVLIEENFGTKNNWDIDLTGANNDVTTIIVRKASGGNELKIRGIAGGTEGRRIRIINDSGSDIKYEEDKTQADEGNRIYIYTSDNKIEEYGSCTLIYSTAISNSGGHWNIVQLDEVD